MCGLLRTIRSRMGSRNAGTTASRESAIRPAYPTSLEQARHLVADDGQHYNCVRLHSALSYIAPMDFLNGLAAQIWAERDRRLEQARSLRAQCRAQLRGQPRQPATSSGELASPLLMNFLGGFALNQNTSPALAWSGCRADTLTCRGRLAEVAVCSP